MEEINEAPVNLKVLCSEPFLPYLSMADIGNLRQVNKQLYQDSRLKKTLLMFGKNWLLETVWPSKKLQDIFPVNNPMILKEVLLKMLYDDRMRMMYSQRMHRFYLFLGGTLTYELIMEKIHQEEQRNTNRDSIINLFTCAPQSCCYNDFEGRCGGFILFNAFSIFFITVPLCMTSQGCTPLIYTGAAMLGYSAGGTAIACLEKECHIFTCCCEPYDQLKKLDEINKKNIPPARIEMIDDLDQQPIFDDSSQHNIISRCFKRLFFKPESCPNELVPLRDIHAKVSNPVIKN